MLMKERYQLFMFSISLIVVLSTHAADQLLYCKEYFAIGMFAIDLDCSRNGTVVTLQ